MIKSLKAYLDNFLQESSEDNISPQNKIELATAVLMIEISLADEKTGDELESYNIVIGSVITIPDGGKVKQGEVFVQWDPYNVPIISEKAGTIKFHDIIEGVTIKQEMDEATGQLSLVVIDYKEDLHPQVIVKST